MKELVQNVNEEMSKLAEEKGLKYEVVLPNADGGYDVVGDQSQLKEAVRNLIDNSIRDTPSGSVKVRLDRENNKILFTVADTGIELSDEMKPKLFTKGGRDKNSQKINTDSAGYGLSIVKSAVEAHQDHIWVESAGPDKGSIFYVELPVV
ncbi:MAG: hypothetical protein COX06_00155 [Candidatus Zambryskibacteria bacterium CG22_combo_CG10-13_8_21_14_all_42_17]|uniref:histidine kinase n=1 Tax=Candidatus Zambryskibacteria bacterium CG22_combo_CG10-13_8_21_14_all_42_17 TaxID=1975118 RepID=A0A2H0BEB7_9BACT|nr:MAG: hypothetical protein COX06_00155 [Candidatus Zambryskibacteria bacterium CG22_combo_CG10-13_8_21_14_all_42_17]